MVFGMDDRAAAIRRHIRGRIYCFNKKTPFRPGFIIAYSVKKSKLSIVFQKKKW